MSKGDIWRVTSKQLNVRRGSNTSFNVVYVLPRGAEIKELESTTDNSKKLWIKHDLGWSCATGYMEKIKEANKKVSTTTDNSEEATAKEIEETDGYGYQPQIEDIYITNSNIANEDFVKIKHVSGVFGLPYQFLPTTDIRLSGDTVSENIGYEYAEKIIERIPLLFLAPGRANFMSRFSKENKRNVLSQLINTGAGLGIGSLEDLVDSQGRYYTFEYDLARYYKFVNPMCRIAAQFLGIGDQVINGNSRLDMVNWEEYTDTGIRSIGDFGTFRSIPFYIDTDTSISESFSNSTTESTLASTVNSVSDMGRELNFLFGYTSGTSIHNVLEDSEVAANIQNVNDIVSGILGGGNFLSNLTNHLVTVATGGRLTFPEIWSDSQFSRSYNCEIKLISPDPSKLSIFLNVLVPLFHLIGLVAPQSIKDNPNGYTNPFIVRAIYKGFFNVDMGIITSMSVTKGAECQWSPEGIPTSITVNIEIKDLYSALSITNTDSVKDWKYDTLNNTALMDYIANLCGINIYKPEIVRSIQMWLMNNGVNRVQDLFETNIWGSMQDTVQNIIMGIYR